MSCKARHLTPRYDTKLCSSNCAGPSNSCRDGECLFGCDPGYRGKKCDEVTEVHPELVGDLINNHMFRTVASAVALFLITSLIMATVVLKIVTMVTLVLTLLCLTVVGSAAHVNVPELGESPWSNWAAWSDTTERGSDLARSRDGKTGQVPELGQSPWNNWAAWSDTTERGSDLARSRDGKTGQVPELGESPWSNWAAWSDTTERGSDLARSRDGKTGQVPELGQSPWSNWAAWSDTTEPGSDLARSRDGETGQVPELGESPWSNWAAWSDTTERGSDLARSRDGKTGQVPELGESPWSNWAAWSDTTERGSDLARSRDGKTGQVPELGQSPWSNWAAWSDTTERGSDLARSRDGKTGQVPELGESPWSNWAAWSDTTERGSDLARSRDGKTGQVSELGQSPWSNWAAWSDTTSQESVESMWSKWAAWSPCSETCSGGVRYRQRACTDQENTACQEPGLNFTVGEVVTNLNLKTLQISTIITSEANAIILPGRMPYAWKSDCKLLPTEVNVPVAVKANAIILPGRMPYAWKSDCKLLPTEVNVPVAIFNAKTSEVITYHQVELKQIFPKSGWVEEDPMEILETTKICIDKAVENLVGLGYKASDIKAVGITNQRETTIVWDKTTGKPLYNAIVWLDLRTASTVDELQKRTPGNDKDYLRSQCGLPLATYFSAVKLRWLLDNSENVRKAAEDGRCMFGTVDSWLVYNLTGGVKGGKHITDVTNASRTMLMSLCTLEWDESLCQFFDIPMSILPSIRSSSEVYGVLSSTSLRGTKISGILGDQQAALVGQLCFQVGQAKNTYGTGCFLLYNTGLKVVESKTGLLTTVAYKLGKEAPAVYALEGAIAIAGACVQWLRDNMGMISTSAEIEKLASAVESTSGCYFVPAFSGLFCPYWQSDARGIICGLTQYTNKNHIARAVLEAVCFQTRELLDAMNTDSGLELTSVKVDGGMTVNSLLMQIQADLLGIEVVRPSMTETTALGAAMAAGSAEGVDVWDLRELMSAAPKGSPSTPVATDIFYPSITSEEREERLAKWKMAVERSMHWDTTGKPLRVSKGLWNTLGPGLYAFGSFGMFLLASLVSGDGARR
ncbi:hypothetical protein EGW08_014066 [Elysia chlorotica]|uniref:Probable glycerol kinase n=1 Tax=Elysia chlorotica TaxID=188477 RepID=A0A3S1BDF9_ELYCH|nr:hypothetical protein EGW08_014066 [Elysia chlorotica]